MLIFKGYVGECERSCDCREWWVFFPLVNFNLDLPDKQDLFVLMLLMFMWVLMKALLCLRWPAWAATLKVA